jgi:hypothetical protein
MTYQWVTAETPTNSSASGPPEKRNPAMPGRARGAEKGLAEVNSNEPTAPAHESLAIQRIATRFRLSIPLARVVCDLAGLGTVAS